MNTPNKLRRRKSGTLRKGTAAVECAIMAPVLTLVVLGAMDVGQFANVHQQISDASREGARMAARYSTKSSADVQAAVLDYLESVSGVPAATIASATTVTVTNSSGGAISGTALGQVPSGAEVRVRVSFQFEAVRWISGVNILNGSQITCTSIMRRQ